MKPLTSLKVLDLTSGSPYLGSMFADYGAEVLKIEPPEGDPMRRRGAGEGQGESPYYAYYGRNKKSMTLDLSRPKGQEIVRRLLPQFDMLAANLSEEVLSAWGLGYEEVHAINPKLVYGILTPFGEEGPWKDLPDYDLLVMARSGLLEKTGFPEKPTKFGFPLSSFYSSWELAAGMLAAYLRAQESGEGCKVSTSAWHTIVSLDDTFAECLQGLNTLPKRLGNGFPTTNPTDTFRCKNGWFALSIGSDDQWLSFARTAGKDVWAEDPRYAHDPARSMENYFGDLDQQLRDYFAEITIEEADRICREAMVPGGPCNTVRELAEGNEQVEAREMLLRVGGGLQLGMPAKFLRDNEHDNDVAPAAALGADTDGVLAQLGFGGAEIDALRTGHVI
ncbi:MAG: CoA transferase [Clostridiaceae bacterium]|nr:CoA transferase [Clostridiaceae bacterium]